MRGITTMLFMATVSGATCFVASLIPGYILTGIGFIFGLVIGALLVISGTDSN